MLGGTRKGFSPSDSDPTTGDMLVQIGSTSLKSISVRSNVSSFSSRRIGATRLSLLRGGGSLSCTNCLSTSDQPEFDAIARYPTTESFVLRTILTGIILRQLTPKPER